MEFNIVYFATVGSNYGGVEQKIIAQFDALVKQTSNIVLYLLCSYSPKGAFAVEIQKRPRVKVLVNNSNKVKHSFYRRKEKFHLISNVLKAYDFANTIVYLRHFDSDFLLLDFLKKNKNFKIVTEHNEIESRIKTRTVGTYLNNVFEFFYGKKVRKRIYAFVGVTKEITEFQLKQSGEYNKRSITIGNGIDVQRYPLRKMDNDHPEIIKLLFVGAGYQRHGLDRVINGMSAYLNADVKPYKIILRVSGESSEMDENRELVSKLKMNEYVEFLGQNSPEDLNIHFNWADIGVGGLGFHRIGLKYTSNLKAREYFSRGLPFFSSTIDEDLIACPQYVNIVDANDTAVNIHDIIQFALKMRSDERHPGKMRSYALRNLDWSKKMKQLVSFLESLVNE